MEYVTVTYKIPKGYEKQFDDLVIRKIEGILSQILLAPDPVKKAEFDSEVLIAKQKNQK